MLALFAFIVIGVFLIADPAFLAEERGRGLSDGRDRPGAGDVVDEQLGALLGPAAGLDEVLGERVDVVERGDTWSSRPAAKIRLSAASRMRSCSAACSLAGPSSSSVFTMRP